MQACRCAAGEVVKTSARLAYSTLFFSSMVLAWVLRDYAKPLVEKIPCERIGLVFWLKYSHAVSFAYKSVHSFTNNCFHLFSTLWSSDVRSHNYFAHFRQMRFMTKPHLSSRLVPQGLCEGSSNRAINGSANKPSIECLLGHSSFSQGSQQVRPSLNFVFGAMIKCTLNFIPSLSP